MNTLKKIPLFILGAPLVLLYGATIVFLYINGVSGSDKWLKDFWQSANHWSLLCSLVLGTACWIAFGFL